MGIKVFNTKGKELNIDNLDFNVGALYQEKGKYVYKLFSHDVLIQREIEEKERLLEETNELAIKYADGDISLEEYEPIMNERINIKLQIKELKKQLNEN